MIKAAKPETPGNAAKELHQSVIQALKTSPSTLATPHGTESVMSQMLGIEVPPVAGPSNLPPANSHDPANQQSTLPRASSTQACPSTERSSPSQTTIWISS